MKYPSYLKIEFKAVPHMTGSRWHLLMYRISPNQDLTYYKEYSFLGFKFKIKHKFNTKWHEVWRYLNHPSAYRYEEKPVNLLLLSCKKDFDEWKDECKTIGDFFSKLEKMNQEELEEWKKAREAYLENCGIWT